MRLSKIPPRLGAPPARIGQQGKPVDPFYHAPEWQQLAKARDRAVAYRCEGCAADFSAEPFKLKADHIVAIKDGGAKLDPSNVQVLCPACDNRKRALEIRERGRGG